MNGASQNNHSLDPLKPDSDETLRIKALIESNQRSNLHLALQLIQGRSQASNFLGHLLALKSWYPDWDIRKKARELFRGSASPRLGNFIRQKWKKDFQDEYNEIKISASLEVLSSFPEINLADIAWMSLKLRKKGGKFCLEKKITDPETVLSEIKSGTSLYLCNFELQSLPVEIGLFKDVKVLNISGNLFDTLPPQIQEMQKLEKIYFTRTPLSPKTVHFLERTFPKVFAEKYYYEADDFKSQGQLQKAYILLNKSSALQPEVPEFWHQMSNCLKNLNRKQRALEALRKALELYQKSLALNPRKANHWYAQSCLLAQSKNKSAALKSLQNAIDINRIYQKKALKELDFQGLHSESDFRKIVGK